MALSGISEIPTEMWAVNLVVLVKWAVVLCGAVWCCVVLCGAVCKVYNTTRNQVLEVGGGGGGWPRDACVTTCVLKTH